MKTTDIGERWIKAATESDVETILAMVSESIVFRPPFQSEEIHGIEDTVKTFRAIEAAFNGMKFERVWADGNSAVLESRTKVAGQPLEVLDVLTVDDAGKIVRFEAFARPISALNVLAEEVKKHLAEGGA